MVSSSNKSDPTTLGWVTIGLGIVIGEVIRDRQRTGDLCDAGAVGESHAAAGRSTRGCGTPLVCALLGLTTAGLAWIPAAVGATVACALVVRRPRPASAWRAVIRAQWAAAADTARSRRCRRARRLEPLVIEQGCTPRRRCY